MIARWTALATVLALLASCSGSGGGAAIDMANAPRLRAGLWVMSGVLNGRAWGPAQICSDGDIAILAPRDPSCTRQSAVRMRDGAIDYHAVCAKRGHTLRMHRRVAGDLSRAFTMDTRSVVTAPGAADVTASSHVQYRFEGACPPGMKAFNPRND